MKLLALLDPYRGYDFRRDTSHLLLLEAAQRGHQVYYAEMSDLVWDRSLQVVAAPVEVLQAAPYFQFQSSVRQGQFAIASFDIILIRKDPPVDASYLHATQLLSLVPSPTLVLNPPRFLQNFNEKMGILHFPEWIPKTLVTNDFEQARLFQKEVEGPLVVKPLDGFAGKGIKKISSFEELANDFAQNKNLPPVMLQEYLTAIHQGEKRLFFCGDHLFPPLLKIPPTGHFLANPDLGATLDTTELTAREKILAEELGRFFRQNGVFLAGVDLIGEKLTEINVTSPGLLWELNEAYGAQFEQDIVDRLLSLVPSRPRLECH